MAVPTPGLGAPPPAKRKRGCFGGCLGCMIPVVVIVLIIGGLFYFLVAQAAAAVSVPAQLVVVNPATTLTHGGSAQPGVSGNLVHGGDKVETDANGRSLIQFQDGSVTRLAPLTKLTLDAAEFDQQGQLHNVSMTQQAGRTLSTVQKLVGLNAKFNVAGHSATASVRGTKFEVIQNADGSVRLKTFVGTVRLDGGHGFVDVSAGQQADASPSGAVTKAVAITPEPADPFVLWLASEEAAKAAGQPATSQTSFSQAPITTGQTAAQPDYTSAGGEVIGELAYPGSAMTLIITDPTGKVHQSTASVSGPAGKLAVVDIPNAPGGAFKVQVRGDNVNPSEHFTVTLVTKFLCAATQSSDAGYVRNVLSANDTRNALVKSGASNVRIRFSGASAGGANIEGSGGFSGVSVDAAAILYAAGGGNVGIAVTRARLNSIDVKQQLTSAIARAGGKNLDSLSIGYQVDRVYTCVAGNDSFLVLEGHA
jgi:hypothetical protein